MCKFFSCISNGKGKLYYFDSKLRQELKGTDLEMDSHTSIAHYFKLSEDECNKYEYNPLTNSFHRDQINTRDDAIVVQKQLDEMDWTTIAPLLIIKKIVNPFKDFDRKKVTKKDIGNLKVWSQAWSQVRSQVRSQARSQVRYQARAQVREQIKYQIREQVWDQVWSQVRSQVRSQARSQVREQVWYQIRFQVWVYAISFFRLQKTQEIKQCQSFIDLYERGLFPIFDGAYWYVLGGHEAKVLWKGKI